MKSKYNSPMFKELYNNFLKMFDEEGDVFESLKESILEEKEHNMTNSSFDKQIVMQVLKDAAIEYYSREVQVLNEDELIKLMVNEES